MPKKLLSRFRSLRTGLKKRSKSLLAKVKGVTTEIRAIPGMVSDRIRDMVDDAGDRLCEVWNSGAVKATRRATFVTSVAGLTLGTVLVALFSFYSLHFEDRILVRVQVPGADLSGLTEVQAQELLHANYAALRSAGIPFEVEGKRYIVPLTAFDIEYDLAETVRRAYAIGHTGDFWQDQFARLTALFTTRKAINAASIVTLEGIEKGMRANIPEVSSAAIDAGVEVQDGDFVVTSAQSGTTTDFESVRVQIVRALESFEPYPIRIIVTEAQPKVTDEEADRAIALARELVTHSITLNYDDHGTIRTWTIDPAKDKSWIAFTKDGPIIKPGINTVILRSHLDTVIAPEVNQERVDATLILPEEGSRFAKIEGRITDGYIVLVEDTVNQVKRDIDDGVFVSSLQVAFEPGKVLTPEGQDLGLKDLLAAGTSNFANSPSGRAYNISYGLSKYDGLLIPPGETFSFNELLGPVDFAHGWKPALAIFGGGASTEPVAGGGLCQVSTTVYRAAVRAGLPIMARSAHSFYVSYYTVGGDGLDATIYLPAPDMKFANDTGAYILVQAYTEGTDAYVKLYGTSDGRTVTLDGPHKSAWSSAGNAVVVETTDLAPGSEIQEKPAHFGRTITWYQTVEYPDGKKVENTIVSNYRAIPAVIKRGVTTLTSTEAEAVPAQPDQVIL